MTVAEIEERWAKAIQGDYVVKTDFTTEIYLGPVKKCEYGFSHKGRILEMDDPDCSDFSKAQLNNTACALANANKDIHFLISENKHIALKNDELAAQLHAETEETCRLRREISELRRGEGRAE